MILSIFSQLNHYTSLHPLFPCVFEFIRETNLLTLPKGRHAIIGEQLFVIIESTHGRNRENAKLESHRKYIDIQWVLEGVDEMGWKATLDCREPMDDYSTEKDIQFFHDTPINWIATPKGGFCIFFPEDAHAPLVGNAEIRKAIFKVAL